MLHNVNNSLLKMCESLHMYAVFSNRLLCMNLSQEMPDYLSTALMKSFLEVDTVAY